MMRINLRYRQFMHRAALVFCCILTLTACEPKIDQKTFMTCKLAVSTINYRPAVLAFQEYQSHGEGKRVWETINSENGPRLVQEIYSERNSFMSKSEGLVKDYNSEICRSMHGQEPLRR